MVQPAAMVAGVPTATPTSSTSISATSLGGGTTMIFTLPAAEMALEDLAVPR